jgi:Fic family protein
MDKLLNDRTGKIVVHPGGNETFVPHKLFPAGPDIKIDMEMMNLLSEAMVYLGELRGVTETVPNPDLFIAFYVQKEALLSSQIEGTQCSLDEVIQVDGKTSEIKPAYEVINYINAMNHGLQELKNIPLSIRLMHDIHKKLLEGVRGEDKRPGEFKDRQNWIGPRGGGQSSAYYVPPPPSMMVELMGDWEKYYHEPKQLPVLIEAAILHSYFETIHPYTDGNGRLGRLLISFMLCERKILDKPLLYISFFFKANRKEYYDLLMDVRFKGQWEEWIKFFLRGVKESSEEAIKTANEVRELQKDHIKLIRANMRSGVAIQTYNLLCEKPINTISAIADRLGISYVTAKNVFEKFLKLGILNVYQKKIRKTLYEYSDYLNILRKGT